MEMPRDIDIEKLPGPKRGNYPALYFRDEIVWSPSKDRFALAYTITEASMCNDVGCVLWGEIIDGKTHIRGNPSGLHASCWQSPWCRWLDDESFLFIAQRYNGKRNCIPGVVIHFKEGFQVLESAGDRWINEIEFGKPNWTTFHDEQIITQIERST